MRRAKAPDHIGILVALKDRLNALKNPYAHLHEPDITFDSVKDSIMLWDPIRYAETCPSSDGACRHGARLGEGRRRGRGAEGRQPAWIHGTAMRSEPTHVGRARHGAARTAARSAPRTSTGRPASPTPARQIDCVEMYVPFSWFEPMWLENLGFAEPGEGWKLTEDGATALDGDLPVNCSAACSPPTRSAPRACSASARPPCRCAARPASTRSTGPALAVGHAYGGGSQFFAMWVVGADKP